MAAAIAGRKVESKPELRSNETFGICAVCGCRMVLTLLHAYGLWACRFCRERLL